MAKSQPIHAVDDASGGGGEAPFPLVREKSGVDRRSIPRWELGVEVSLTSESQFFAGITGDVSLGGVFVATYQSRPVGDRIDLEFTLPTGTIRARGTVRWIREASEGAAPGLGIAFDALSDEDRGRIEAFCETRAPLYYDVDD